MSIGAQRGISERQPSPTVGPLCGDSQVGYLEMVSQSGNMYLVAKGDHRDTGKAFHVNGGTILVTLHDTNTNFFETPKQAARATLPPGPDHQLMEHDITVKGIAWGAAYPGPITTKVKSFAEKSASRTQAISLLTN